MYNFFSEIYTESICGSILLIILAQNTVQNMVQNMEHFDQAKIVRKAFISTVF
jgi:hypothetical protein